MIGEDPFETLGVEPRFDLDEQTLAGRRVALLAETHPDRFDDPLEQAEAAERSAAVNAAYERLRSPRRRAEALLERSGLGAGGEKPQVAPELMMQVMEARERLESAPGEAVASELRAWAESEQSSRLARVASEFVAARDGGGLDDDAAARIRAELAGLAMFDRVVAEADRVRDATNASDA